jgi:arginyl-tRNA synthetase
MEIIISNIANEINENLSEKIIIVKNNDIKNGNYTINLGRFKNKDQIISVLNNIIPNYNFVEKYELNGNFYNIWININYVANIVINDIISYLNTDKTNDRKVVIEFSSPNTNKPQHLGHVRNNLIGQSVYNLLKWTGVDVKSINLINDRGIHICKSMLAYKYYGDNKTPTQMNMKGDHMIGYYYVLFNNLIKKEQADWCKENNSTIITINEEEYFNKYSVLGNECKNMLLKWESGDKEVLELWSKLNGWVLDGFNETYGKYGIRFDHIEKESTTYIEGKEIIENNLEIFTKKSDGSIVFELNRIGLNGDKIVLRSDGTSIYITQDIGTLFRRTLDYNLNELIYVVADEQSHYFNILFEICKYLAVNSKSLNIPNSIKYTHLSYGLVNLPTGRLKSREGQVVDADNLLNDVINLLLEKYEGEWSTKDKLSKNEINNRVNLIALSAIKYSILSARAKSSITFDPAKSINIYGNTGPYILYTYARIMHIKKNIIDWDLVCNENIIYNKLSTMLEQTIISELINMKQSIEKSINDLDVSYMLSGLYNLCKSFNSFYNDKAHSVANCRDVDLKKERILICNTIKNILEVVCTICGIELLESM